MDWRAAEPCQKVPILYLLIFFLAEFVFRKAALKGHRSVLAGPAESSDALSSPLAEDTEKIDDPLQSNFEENSGEEDLSSFIDVL